MSRRRAGGDRRGQEVGRRGQEETGGGQEEAGRRRREAGRRRQEGGRRGRSTHQHRVYHGEQVVPPGSGVREEDHHALYHDVLGQPPQGAAVSLLSSKPERWARMAEGTASPLRWEDFRG